MTSVRGRGRTVRRGQASKAPTGPLSSNGDHENPLGQMNQAPPRLLLDPKPLKPVRDLLKLLPDPLRFPLFPLPRILALIATANRTWIESSRHFSRTQRVDLETSSRPRPRTSTALDPTWNAITCVCNVRTILPPAGPPGQTEFRLRPPSSGTESISAGSNTSGS